MEDRLASEMQELLAERSRLLSEVMECEPTELVLNIKEFDADGTGIVRIQQRGSLIDKRVESKAFFLGLVDREKLVARFMIGDSLWGNQAQFISELYRWLKYYAQTGHLGSLTFSLVEDPVLLVFKLEARPGQQGSEDDPEAWDNFAY